MAITTDKLVKYLRDNIDIRLPDEDVKDELYLKMSDDDILLYIEMAHSRGFADYDIGDSEIQYALMLLSKKELYMGLALRHAAWYDIGADDNNYLKRSQWFTHYMQLATQADKDYLDYLENEGIGGLNGVYAANTYLANRYYTDYNWEKAKLPTVRVKLDRATENALEISWRTTQDRYDYVQVWVSTLPIADLYVLDKDQVSELAKRVAKVSDPHITHCRINGCEPDTTYYVMVDITDWTGRTVFKEIEVKTLAPVEDVGEVDAESQTVSATL